MAAILPPRRQGRYPDRDLECQEAMEGAFQELLGKASEAGWRPDEISEAVEALAMADRRTRHENACIDASLALASLIAAR